MYSPYLFARAAELYSLRELATAGVATQQSLPILEPVNSNPRDLITCLNIWNSDIVVIVNPYQNHYSNHNNTVQLNQDLQPVITAKNNIIIGVLVQPGSSYSSVNQILNNYNGKRIALIYDNASLSDGDFNALASNGAIDYHIIINNSVPHHQYSMLPRNKIIIVNDSFRKLTKNADYNGSELFSSLHQHLNQSYIGYGDFTITGRAFDTNGGPASAVASHLIYKNNNDNNIWIQHFVSSNTQRGGAPVATMFLDVSNQIIQTVSQLRVNYGNNIGLDNYNYCCKNNHYPGLTKNKQYQITHHISLMLDVITGRI